MNVGGSANPKSSQARLYNTTQALVALHALGAKPKHDPFPVLAAILREDYKKFPLYTTSFFPLAYQAVGSRFRRGRSEDQGPDGPGRGWVRAKPYCQHVPPRSLLPAPERGTSPDAEAILKRVLHDQKADGSWLLNPPSWDVHAGFDAVFVLRQIGKDQAECRQAMQKAAGWALALSQCGRRVRALSGLYLGHGRGLLPRRHVGDGRIPPAGRSPTPKCSLARMGPFVGATGKLSPYLYWNHRPQWGSAGPLLLWHRRRSMGPQQMGGIPRCAEVGRTEAQRSEESVQAFTQAG